MHCKHGAGLKFFNFVVKCIECAMENQCDTTRVSVCDSFIGIAVASKFDHCISSVKFLKCSGCDIHLYHFKEISKCVPGPLDPGFANILPRPPFADVITSYFKEKIPNSVFTTNPCRIKYCTKEIVILREDIMTKMVRGTIFHPTAESNADTFVKTLVGQSHLSPLPLHSCPVYWSYDHALSLYPLPNVTIIGDSGDAFNIQNSGCHFVNPGPFTGSNYSFMIYNPFTDEVEDSFLPPDAE